MDSKIAKEVIGVIRTESQRRSDQLKDEDPNAAYDQWLFTDEPFINEMCLMVLVALHHQVERELVFLAARANAGPTITSQQYQRNVKDQRQKLKSEGKRELIATLTLASFAEWDKSMETLRLLANCLKHEPHQHPDETLLKRLNLPNVDQLKQLKPLIDGYLPLPESSSFREGLAAYVNLPKDADYCTIAEKFADLANKFLEDVRQNTSLARITGSKVSFGC
jgi:hypothetical protein